MAVREIDIHFRLHDLRHTFASESLRSGASLFEVAVLMGHSDIKLGRLDLRPPGA